MKAEQYGALFLVIVATLTLVYLAVAHNSEQAAGALIAVVAAGTSYYLRGKVQAQ